MFRAEEHYPTLRLNYKLEKIDHFVKMRWPQQTSFNVLDNTPVPKCLCQKRQMSFS